MNMTGNSHQNHTTLNQSQISASKHSQQSAQQRFTNHGSQATSTNNNQSTSINYNHQHQTNQNNSLPSNVISCPSLAFQQVKQTQASLARLSRYVHLNNNNNNNQQNNQGQSNTSSQHSKSDQVTTNTTTTTTNLTSHQIKSSTFVDCLIRRFKNCFSQDYCEVPVFVVGNLSPGSDGKY